MHMHRAQALYFIQRKYISWQQTINEKYVYKCLSLELATEKITSTSISFGARAQAVFNVQCSMLALTKIQRISAKAHKHKTSDKK